MATSLLTLQRPIQSGSKHWLLRLNWRWILQRSPILALGIDGSHNVAKYVGLDGTSPVIQIVNGITFDLIFIGMIALVDQHRSAKASSNMLFWIINVGAMLFAAIFGTLAYSHGMYSLITAESITRGAFPPLLGLLYNLFYHTVTGEVFAEDRKRLLEFPYECGACSERFKTVKARNGHRAQCGMFKQQKSSKP